MVNRKIFKAQGITPLMEQLSSLAVILTAFITAGINVPFVHGEKNAGDTADHFGILCRIYKVSTATSTSISSTAEVSQIQSRVDQINASLSDDKWFNELLKERNDTELGNEPNAENGARSEDWMRWRKAALEVNESNNFEKLPSGSTAARLARNKLKRIGSQMERVIEEIKKKSGASRLEEIAKLFKRAIYGNTQNEKDVNLYQGAVNRNETCGGESGFSGKVAHAGKSLVLDFLCLCGKAEGGEPKVCGELVNVNDAGNWNTTTGENGERNWNIIKGACEKTEFPKSGLAAEGLRAVADFENALSKGTKTIAPAGRGNFAVHPGVFGVCNSARYYLTEPAIGCGGGRDRKSCICVYYGAASDWKNIQWLQHTKSALRLLEAAETTQLDMTRLKMLQSRAEEIYEEAKMTLEHENPRWRMRSHSYHPSFFLPWTLLI
ncbi:Variant surface glycoprotein [Trypanosoma congolense IL3000]|uniref:Variant surface glycoprotein n=1 Tax=Trypanosoma congolense (strain IL3000) TaxID=1068625 RepID=F9W875_TRYCI|nr:Variant surface glycoprotein [Trypanosoma congolense IL3000]